MNEVLLINKMVGRKDTCLLSLRAHSKHVNNVALPIYLAVHYLCGGTYAHSVQWISYSVPRYCTAEHLDTDRGCLMIVVTYV